MDASSVLGGITIGRDTSGNFRLSPAGLAVRFGDRWVVNENGQLRDVTGLTIESIQNVVVRIPSQRVAAGDVVVLSDNPLNVLFVQNVDQNGHLHGLELESSQVVEYVPTNNILGMAVLVRAVNLAQAFNPPPGGGGGRNPRANNLLPLLLLSGGNGGDKIADALLLSSALGGQQQPQNIANLLPLLFLRSQGGALDSLLLAGAFGGGNDVLANLFNPGPPIQPRAIAGARQPQARAANRGRPAARRRAAAVNRARAARPPAANRP